MKVSQGGINLIKSFEGYRSYAYQDIGGVWTIGYGHTKNVQSNDVITEDEADALLLVDIENFEREVNQVVSVPMTQEMFDALVSFTFNIGGTNFRKSTLVKKLNQYDYLGASQEFQRWIYVRSERSQGLINRREKEKLLFMKIN